MAMVASSQMLKQLQMLKRVFQNSVDFALLLVFGESHKLAQVKMVKSFLNGGLNQEK